MGKTLLKTAALAAVAGALALGSVSDAEAQGRVKWKMQAAFASTLACAALLIVSSFWANNPQRSVRLDTEPR